MIGFFGEAKLRLSGIAKMNLLAHTLQIFFQNLQRPPKKFIRN